MCFIGVGEMGEYESVWARVCCIQWNIPRVDLSATARAMRWLCKVILRDGRAKPRNG